MSEKDELYKFFATPVGQWPGMPTSKKVEEPKHYIDPYYWRKGDRCGVKGCPGIMRIFKDENTGLAALGCDICSNVYNPTKVYYPGDPCGLDGCCGYFEIERDPCTCHTSNPPCSACTNAKLICTQCGREAENWEA